MWKFQAKKLTERGTVDYRTCVANRSQSLQTYDLKRGLNLLFLSRPQTPVEITATLAWKDRVFAAWGGQESAKLGAVWVFKRGKKVAELQLEHGLDEPVQTLVNFGSWIVGCCLTKIEVWKSDSYEHYTTLTPLSSWQDDGADFLTGCICNMPTFLNKIFVGRQDGSVEIWNVKTGKLIFTILSANLENGGVCALQPTPVLSLLAIAYENGSLIIHNVETDKSIIQLNSSNSTRRFTIRLISFRSDGLGAGGDGKEPGVMATAGYDSGDITFWDLNNGGKVMGVLRGAHTAPTQVLDGVIGGISGIEFLPGQPLIVSTGLDNTLKTWLFDESPFSPIPRILHSRGGHAAPVTCLEFLPVNSDGADSVGKWLLSSGSDRSLWGWSLRRDGQSSELSQGNIRKKARKMGLLGSHLTASGFGSDLAEMKSPEITCMAVSLIRDGGMGASAGGGAVWTNMVSSAGKKNRTTDAASSGATGWESIVTGHKGDKFARTWFWGRKKAGRWAFETSDGSDVMSVAISPCGTFALIGSSIGGIDMFNLQSGLHRQRFPARIKPAQARKSKTQIPSKAITVSGSLGTISKIGPGQGRHTKAVSGIVVDSLNRNVISCSLDGRVKFWDFATGNLIDEINWSPTLKVTALRSYLSSDLIAVSCDDLSIRVVDTETKRLIREFWGCVGDITDFCFSNDGRWVIAASTDSVIRIWDLPTGNLIDAMRFQNLCTAMSFSSTGEFLATAHANSVGVNIWNNRTLFAHVPTRRISEDDISLLEGPTASGEGGQGLIEAAFGEEYTTETSLNIDFSATVDQLSRDITTLSIVPRSRWQTLLHLDTIKQRNKPKDPPKAPEKAPFFLPSLENAKPIQAAASKTHPQPNGSETRIIKTKGAISESQFTALLRESREIGSYKLFIEHLKTLPPAAADLEIRSLTWNESRSELVDFVRALTSRLQQKLDYELVQAWMAVFLRLHGEMAGSSVDLKDALTEWRKEQEQEAQRLNGLVGYCTGVVSFLRSAR
ncbi:MAG: hypothetical protein M1829_002976 [Trizodia sp. TS-e1964]|nr:MAG: hypothetical protein M1829_002976 [Trizodia sp. TS-e1964]